MAAVGPGYGPSPRIEGRVVRLIVALLASAAFGTGVASGMEVDAAAAKRAADHFSDSMYDLRSRIYHYEHSSGVPRRDVSNMAGCSARLTKLSDRIVYNAKVYQTTFRNVDLNLCREALA